MFIEGSPPPLSMVTLASDVQCGVDLSVQIFVEGGRMVRSVGAVLTVHRGWGLGRGRLEVRQRISQLVPEQIVSPTEYDVVLQQQPQVGVHGAGLDVA